MKTKGLLVALKRCDVAGAEEEINNHVNQIHKAVPVEIWYPPVEVKKESSTRERAEKLIAQWERKSKK